MTSSMRVGHYNYHVAPQVDNLLDTKEIEMRNVSKTTKVYFHFQKEDELGRTKTYTFRMELRQGLDKNFFEPIRGKDFGDEVVVEEADHGITISYKLKPKCYRVVPWNNIAAYMIEEI